MRTRC
jgi:hypothetical protein